MKKFVIVCLDRTSRGSEKVEIVATVQAQSSNEALHKYHDFYKNENDLTICNFRDFVSNPSFKFTACELTDICINL